MCSSKVKRQEKTKMMKEEESEDQKEGNIRQKSDN